MQPSLLFELEHQRPGCLVADNGEKISLGRHSYRHTGRGLLCAGLTPGEPDTFQDNRTGQLMLFGFQTGHEGLTPQSILLFKTERHQPDRSRERLHAELRRYFEEDHQPTRVIVCARRPRHGVVVSSDQEWGQRFSLSGPNRALARHHIAVGLAPRAYELAVCGPARLGKLRRQIVRRPSKRAGTRLRMTLPGEGFKMTVDSKTLGYHGKKLNE
jgi:hypothetical protein